MRTETIGNQTLVLGDCRDVLETLVGDCFLTDPFYGVDGGKGGQARERGKAKYIDLEDTPTTVAQIAVPVVAYLAVICQRGAVTPGNPCMFLYPKPREVGCFWQPAANGLGPWGFCNFQPIFYYGTDFRAGRGPWPTGRQVSEQAQKNGHPCPKPLEAWQWLLQKVSQEGETVIDPFLGSGTTLVACQQLGRRGIGVEICEEYFEIACRRVEWAVRGLKEPTAPKPTESGQTLFEESSCTRS